MFKNAIVRQSCKNFVAHPPLQRFDLTTTATGDEYPPNTLFIDDHLIVPAGYPKTKFKLEALGFEIIELNVKEVRKMDGA